MRASVAILIGLGLALAAQSAAAAGDPAGDRLDVAAEACIRAAASRVASRAAGLSDAVSFIVDDLCAADIRHALAYERNRQLLAVLGSAAKKAPPTSGAPAPAPPAGPTIDPKTGGIVLPPQAGAKLAIPLLIANVVGGRLGGGDAEARFRTLAAESVLAQPASRR